MPQPKQYKNAAIRQAAYRNRHQKPPTQASLARLAMALIVVIADDAQSQHPRLPSEIALAQDAQQTLRNLICWLDPVKDTIRHPDWDLFHPERTDASDTILSNNTNKTQN